MMSFGLSAAFRLQYGAYMYRVCCVARSQDGDRVELFERVLLDVVVTSYIGNPGQMVELAELKTFIEAYQILRTLIWYL